MNKHLAAVWILGAILTGSSGTAWATPFDDFCAKMGLSNAWQGYDSPSECMMKYNGMVPVQGQGPRYTYAQAQSFVQKLGSNSVCPPGASANPYERDIFDRLNAAGTIRLSATCQAPGYYLNRFRDLAAGGARSFCVPSDADFSDLLVITMTNPNIKVDPTCSANSQMSNAAINVSNNGLSQGITGSIDLKEIDMPCVPGSTDGEVAANRAKGGALMKAFRACKDFLPELQSDVNAQIKNWAEQFYNGCSVDPTSTNKVGSCQGTPLTGEVCNVLDQPAVPKTFSPASPETDTNHLGKACGNWIQMNPHLEGRSCVLDTMMGNGFHQREESYIRGARIQALNCKYNRVLNQINRTNKLKLTYLLASTPQPVPGICAAVSPNWRTATNQAEKMLSAVINGDQNTTDPNQKLGFSQAKLLDDIDNCKENVADQQNFMATVSDPGKRRQGACYIKGMRAAIEAMAKQLAACEAHYQAQLSYEQFLGATNQAASIDTVVRKLINGSVDSSLSSSATVNSTSGLLNFLTSFRQNKCTSKSSSDCSVNNVRDHCYAPAFLQVLQIRANDVWNQDSCN